MTTEEEIVKELGEFYSSEKEDIESIITSLQEVLTAGKIDENIVTTLSNVEKELGVLRLKYTQRLLALYKLKYKFMQ